MSPSVPFNHYSWASKGGKNKEKEKEEKEEEEELLLL